MIVGSGVFHRQVAQELFDTEFHTAVPRTSVRAKPSDEAGVGKNGEKMQFRPLRCNISETVGNRT